MRPDVDLFQELTASSLNQLVGHVVMRLQELKVNSTSKVALYFHHPDNTFGQILTLVSLMTLGAEVTLLSHRLTLKESSKILDRVGARALIKGRVKTAREDEITNSLPIAEHIDCTEIMPSSLAVTRPDINPLSTPTGLESSCGRHSLSALHQDATINIATSGSSGAPKIVKHSIPSLSAAARAQSRALGITNRSRLLASLSPCHIGGLMIIMRALAQRATLIIPSGATTDHTTRPNITGILCSSQASHCSIVPTQLLELLGTNASATTLPHLQSLLIGGAPSSPKSISDALSRGLPLQISYGMTETAALGVLNKAPSAAAPLNVGFPIEGVTITIIDESTNEILSQSTTGKIAISSPTLFTSYITESGDHAPPPNPYITSDQGYLEPDGSLVVLGRLDRVIISGGIKISPLEIEHTARRFPGVQDAAVCALPDEKWGERPGLLVEVGPKQISTKEATSGSSSSGSSQQSDEVNLAGFLDHLRTFLATELGRTKLPARIVATPSLPRNAIGKVDYVQVQIALDDAG